MLIDTYEMQARRGVNVDGIPACKAFFPFNETTGVSFTEAVSGGIYTPDDTSDDAGAIAFNNDYSITIGDNVRAIGDFIVPDNKPIAFGTDPIIGIVAGPTILLASTSHATIGDADFNGSFGISTSNLHLGVTGDGAGVFGNAQWPLNDQTNFGDIIYIAEYYPGGTSRFRIMDIDGTAGDDVTADTPEDVGNVTITNAGRFHGLDFRGAAWFSVTETPEDLVEGAVWMANQWKLGRKVIYPGAVSWK